MTAHFGHFPTRSFGRYAPSGLVVPPSALLPPQVRQHCGPIGEGIDPELDVLALEEIDPLLRSIIDQEIAIIEVLVMAENEALMG